MFIKSCVQNRLLQITQTIYTCFQNGNDSSQNFTFKLIKTYYISIFVNGFFRSELREGLGDDSVGQVRQRREDIVAEEVEIFLELDFKCKLFINFVA